MGLGWQELIIIFFIVLLVFGAKRLPEIARSMGKATSEFKRAKDGLLEPETPETPPAPAERKAEPPREG